MPWFGLSTGSVRKAHQCCRTFYKCSWNQQSKSEDTKSSLKEDKKAQKAIKPETASSAKIHFRINQLQLKYKPKKEGQLGQ